MANEVERNQEKAPGNVDKEGGDIFGGKAVSPGEIDVEFPLQYDYFPVGRALGTAGWSA